MNQEVVSRMHSADQDVISNAKLLKQTITSSLLSAE